MLRFTARGQIMHKHKDECAVFRARNIPAFCTTAVRVMLSPAVENKQWTAAVET